MIFILGEGRQPVNPMALYDRRIASKHPMWPALRAMTGRSLRRPNAVFRALRAAGAYSGGVKPALAYVLPPRHLVERRHDLLKVTLALLMGQAVEPLAERALSELVGRRARVKKTLLHRPLNPIDKVVRTHPRPRALFNGRHDG